MVAFVLGAVLMVTWLALDGFAQRAGRVARFATSLAMLLVLVLGVSEYVDNELSRALRFVGGLATGFAVMIVTTTVRSRKARR